jgi:hypothetical protein
MTNNSINSALFRQLSDGDLSLSILGLDDFGCRADVELLTNYERVLAFNQPVDNLRDSSFKNGITLKLIKISKIKLELTVEL